MSMSWQELFDAQRDSELVRVTQERDALATRLAITAQQLFLEQADNDKLVTALTNERARCQAVYAEVARLQGGISLNSTDPGPTEGVLSNTPPDGEACIVEVPAQRPRME